MPSVMSSANAPVGMAATPTLPCSPRRMHRALAVLLLDLAERHLEGLVSFHAGTLLWV